MITEWDIRFFGLARQVGEWSKDPSRKVGCVIVGPRREIRAVGYNGFPRGTDDKAQVRHDRPSKYLWTEHAERNAIFEAARIGVAVQGCTMYVTWFPCMDCARAIVQVGIFRLVGVRPNLEEPEWGAQFAAAQELLKEVGVEVEVIDAP